MDRLAELVERLTRDLDDRAVVRWGHDGQPFTAALVIDGEWLCAAGMSGDAAVEDAASHIVNVFQDTVIENHGGRPIPACPVPGHPHPAALRRTPGGLGWRCPAADAPVAH